MSFRTLAPTGDRGLPGEGPQAVPKRSRMPSLVFRSWFGSRLASHVPNSASNIKATARKALAHMVLFPSSAGRLKRRRISAPIITFLAYIRTETEDTANAQNTHKKRGFSSAFYKSSSTEPFAASAGLGDAPSVACLCGGCQAREGPQTVWKRCQMPSLVFRS